MKETKHSKKQTDECCQNKGDDCCKNTGEGCGCGHGDEHEHLHEIGEHDHGGCGCGHDHSHDHKKGYSVEDIAYNNHFVINALVGLLLEKKLFTEKELEDALKKIVEHQH